MKILFYKHTLAGDVVSVLPTVHDNSNHHIDKVSFLISLPQSHLLIYKYTHAHRRTLIHGNSTSGNNNQLEYPGKGWLHHVNDLIQMSFS